jgi:phage terminase large subunit
MKKALAVLMMALATNAFAYYENPHQQFDMTRNKTNETKIKFIQAKDVTKACDAESKRRGFGGFGIAVDACSFYNWSMDECTIITPLTANFHTLGHEVRHCLQGAFHK